MKKWRVFLFFLFILLIISISVTAIQDNVVVTPKKFNKNNELIVVDLTIPQISGMGNKDKERVINQNFDKEANDAYEAVEKQAKEDYDQSQKYNIPFTNYEANYSYLISYNKNGVLSIPVDISTYTGGAHGMTVRKSNNFDIHTGERLLLKDLFIEGYNYKSVFDNIINGEISKNKDNYFQGSFKGIKADSDYFLNNKGIVVYFQLYEIAPYAAGMPEFLIPYSKINKGLNYELSK